MKGNKEKIQACSFWILLFYALFPCMVLGQTPPGHYPILDSCHINIYPWNIYYSQPFTILLQFPCERKEHCNPALHKVISYNTFLHG